MDSSLKDIRDPIVDFSWSPTGPTFAITVGNESYPPSGARFQATSTPTLDAITFTAAVNADPLAPISSYRWDLGDGTILLGSSVIHTYLIANSTLSARLSVTDQLGRTYSVSKPLLLAPLDRVVPSGSIAIIPGSAQTAQQTSTTLLTSPSLVTSP